MEVFGELKAGVRLRRPLNATDLFNRVKSGKSPVSLFRRGGRLFLSGDAEGVGQYFDPNEFLGPEEVLFDSGGEIETSSLDHEEIELSNFDTVETPLEASPLATETTPLLGAAAPVAATGGSTATSVGAGVLITGVTAGIGGAIVHYSHGVGREEDEAEREEPAFSLPDHRYLGPGNTADSDPSLPIDEDDRIAQQHDIDYTKVKTADDVHIADDIAIEKFSKDFLETGNPHSAIGAIGLGIKRGGETLFGVKYPSLPSPGVLVPETQSQGEVIPETGPQTIPASDEDVDMGDAGGQRGAKRPRVEPAAAVGNDGSGHQSGSDGGFDSAQGPVKFLRKGGYRVNSGQMTFRKVHRMKTWALPYKVLATNDRNGAKLTVTPLAKIPWEYMFMYCSPEDFALIPAGSYVHTANIDITQIVASTAFPTGGTESTTVTANHPKIACIGIDLENKMRGGIDKSLDIDENMIPTAVTGTAETMFENFISHQYGTDQTVENQVVPGAAFGIPFYNNCHYCIYNPNVAQAAARGFTAETAPGYEYFKNCIQEYNANDTTYSKVLGMSYKFESAPIGEQFPPLEIYTTNFQQSTGNAAYYNAQRTVTGNNVGGDTTITETFLPSSRNTLPIVTYSSSMIEKGANFTRGDSAGKPSRQPTIHIGMRAIDKNDPTVGTYRAEQFVQAVIDFEITCTLTVNLPSYPNRFVRAKFFNTSIENCVGGIGRYDIPANGNSRVVTFGLANVHDDPPAVAEVDQVNDEPTESGLSIPGRKQRPRRALPRVPKAVRPATRSTTATASS